MRRPAARGLAISIATVIALASAGCSGSIAPTAQPTVEPTTASVAPTPSLLAPTPTVAPRPSGTLAWPTAFNIEFKPGTYAASPPFGIPFTIRIAETGWFSGHADPEFVDLLRFDGLAVHEWPSQMVAFGELDHVRGRAGPVNVTGMTPRTALQLLADRADLDAGDIVAQSLIGLDGARADVHADANDTPLLGKGSVELRQGPQLDMRLVLLDGEGGMLMVGVLAPPGGVEAAWEHAQSILETVRLSSPG